jgi:hypothetical protein
MQHAFVNTLQERGYQVEFHSHAAAILGVDFPEALDELARVLAALTIPIERIVRGGGGESETTQGLRRELAALGWQKHNFEVVKMIDGVPREAISHQVDHVRALANGRIALEIEWNNKDPFFDRDLENFKRLHAEGAISVGIIVTRGRALQDNIKAIIQRFAEQRGIAGYDDLAQYGIAPTGRQRGEVERRLKTARSFAEAWADPFCQDKYGQATTHWRKLEDRVRRGVGNPCPLLLIGIPDTVVSFATEPEPPESDLEPTLF